LKASVAEVDVENLLPLTLRESGISVDGNFVTVCIKTSELLVRVGCARNEMRRLIDTAERSYEIPRYLMGRSEDVESGLYLY